MKLGQNRFVLNLPIVCRCADDQLEIRTAGSLFGWWSYLPHSRCCRRSPVCVSVDVLFPDVR